VDRAKRRHDWVSEHGNLGGLCQANRDLQEAYFNAKDMKSYQFWHMSVESACMNSKLLGASTPANGS